MTMSLPEEIKQRLNILDVISSYVPSLSKSGRNYKATCPFHSEQTPSFIVFPERQSWRCFGACAEGGDLITFVMKAEKLDFTEAIKALGIRAGITADKKMTGRQVNADLYQINELANILKDNGANIKYAIHPVAGRMPGHMNVLLAEANIPYNELKDLDEINSEFDNADVAVVVGANDVTNPIARTDPSSPIYGMPILNVDKAKSVIVLKRSMASGFAGIENELFFLDKTSLLFGDARDSIEEMTREIKNLDNI